MARRSLLGAFGSAEVARFRRHGTLPGTGPACSPAPSCWMSSSAYFLAAPVARASAPLTFILVFIRSHLVN